MHIKPKKRLGQNFLTDKNIQRKIIEACEFKPSDVVLEIGSGSGELTKLMARHVSKIYALEIDPYLCNELRKNLEVYSNVKIINQDILKFNLKNYFGKLKSKVKVVGNIPYYISSPIIAHLLEFRDKIDVIFITVQKELAQRAIASPGSKVYGAFSCFVQYYAKPKITLNIKKTCFFPIPKVDSCLLRLDIRRKLTLTCEQEKLLFRIIRAAFNKRRKTLRNSLREIIPKEWLESFFKEYKIDMNIRPEDLALQDFVTLANTNR